MSGVPATPAAGRRFRLVVGAWASATALILLLLSPLLDRDARASVTAAGLLVAGVTATTAGFLRARRSAPAVARPWWLLVTGGVVLLIGNAWSAAVGADPVTSPSLLGNVCIAIALLLSTLALATFPGARRRGSELLVMYLDGVVAGGAFLLISSALVYSELLSSSSADDLDTANRALSLLFPALDVVLVTVALMLVLRARRADRLMLGLVAAAFLLYAASDLTFAVLTAEGTFRFGSLLDAGWIVGYLTLALAAEVPGRAEPEQDPDDSADVRSTDVIGTALVFAVLAGATVVQVVFGGTGGLQTAQSILWVIIVVAAGTRQLLLTSDNRALRRDLEHRVAEQTADLRRLARQTEVLITSVGDGVYGVDHEGRVTFVNPSAAHMLGWSPDELRGRRAHDTFHAPDAEGVPFPWTGCYIHEAIRHGDLASAEEDEYVRADGSRFAVEITASPLLEDATVRGAVVTFRDVTQRREVERMKNEFLSVVSHELRTPLTSIRGSLGLLGGGRLGELPERAASLVNVALQSSERLTRLINDLLDIERMESGTKPMEMLTLEVRGLLETAAGQIEGMASQTGVAIVVRSAEGRVLADEDRIIQTLLNLLGNAIKFSDRGSVVELDARTVGAEVHIRVRDHGRGIPADKLESIFERFEQVDSSDTRQKGGTGLGLTISRGIVEKHGGRIWAESELGEGTTIHVTLPSAARLSSLASTGGPDRGAGQAVLVCDDDAAVVEQFCTMLRLHGYRAIGVTDGSRALDVIRAERPHAVVLDLMMPGTTGAEVLAAVRSSETTHDLPIVIISGLGPDADADAASRAEDWLVKPVSEARLVNAVALAVAGRSPDGSVLLVEDDEGLAEVLATMLGDAGLQVVHVSSAREAIERGADLEPDVIVLDMRLPDGNGQDVVTAFHHRWALAHTPLVVYSAVDLDPSRREDLKLGPTVFLDKGETGPEELRDRVLALVRAVTDRTTDRTPTA